MKNDDINKHGLKRYIPADIRRKIRQDAGYGCVMCGKVFTDYEHIEPEFNNAREHDPEKMTLLCKGCHDDVTDKRISKRKVWLAKENPFTKKNKLVKGILDPDTDEMKLKIGSLISIGASIVIIVHGKPLFWFSVPETSGEPLYLNAIFSDDKGIIAYIEDNIFHGVVASQDIDTEGYTIEVRYGVGDIALILKAEGDAPLFIERFSFCYLGNRIKLDKKGITINEFPVLSVEQSLTISMNKNNYIGCSFVLLDIPQCQVKDHIGYISTLEIALSLKDANKVYAIDGEVAGWVVDNLIISKMYTCVAFLKEDKDGLVSVYGVTDEFIGFLKRIHNGYILVYMEKNYESGEPIWISNQNIRARNIFLRKEYDLSHRIFYR
ncbi:TPA: HNH endonuclease [Klebsiella variicola]